MESYKLVAIDLDDTLLRSDLTVSEHTVAVLRQVRDLGVAVTISTGRMFSSARPFAEQLEFDVPLITYGGALVKNAGSGEVLYNRPLEPEVARRVIRFARERKVQVNFYLLNGEDDELYAELTTYWGENYGRFSRVLFNRVPDLEALLERGNPLKLLLIDEEPAVDRWLLELRGQLGEQAHFAKSKPRFLEVDHPEATKGRALQELAAWLQVERSQVLAIGDSYNDIEMLEFAGLGIAVANAPPEVRRRAGHVTASNDKDGVAQALERFVLGATGL
ncbi:MAG: Cof-type HAD-IIB family hydrolase [Thermacetogeniaceae bacterium]